MPFPVIGWDPTRTATRDPRVPVTCPWCQGRRSVLETLEGQPRWVLLPVVCRRCEGRGSIRIERRTGAR